MLNTDDAQGQGEGEFTIAAADELADMVEGRTAFSYAGLTKVTSVRIPLHLAVKVQALAYKSGKTRNAIIVNLLEVGLEELHQRLKSTTLEELKSFETKALLDLSRED